MMKGFLNLARTNHAPRNDGAFLIKKFDIK